MKILRVFPERTSYTPTDDYVFIGYPPTKLIIPEHDEVHISCVFTWHREYCRELMFQWQGVTEKPVLLGGPAFGSPANDFTPGLYVKSGVIFTSRGCNNSCPWCSVPRVEGRLKELPIVEGNIIQDNNFLQTSAEHRRKVFDMLKGQYGICFKGGLQADLITDETAAELAKLRIAELWLACDTDAALPRLKKAVQILERHGLGRNGRTKKGYLFCYCLIGDDMKKNEARLTEVYNAGAMPFAQLYQPTDSDRKIEYSEEWKAFVCTWSRPAATESRIKRGTVTRPPRNQNTVYANEVSFL